MMVNWLGPKHWRS